MIETGLVKEADQRPLFDDRSEKGCLGSMMLVSSMADACRDIVKPEHFRELSHQRVCRAIYKLRDEGSELDAVIVSAELERAGHLEDVGGYLFIAELMDAIPHAMHAEYYAREVVRWWKRRTVAFATARVNRSSYNSTIDENDLIAELADAVEEASGDESKRVSSLKDAVIRVLDKIDPEKPQEPALKTKFCDLDEALSGGFRKKALTILAARPGTGKTALACDLIETMGTEGIHFESLEMPEVEIAERLLSIKTQIPFTSITRGTLDFNQREAIALHSNALAELPVFIDDRTDRTVSQIRASCRTHSLRHPLGIVVVDYLQLLAPENKRDSREQQVAQMAVGLKNLAKDLNVHVLALCQLSRDIEKRADRRPKLSDLRESGAIEQAADVVIFLDRPSVYDDSAEKTEASLIIAKNRHGATCDVPLYCDMTTLTFRSAAKKYGGMEPDYFDEWNQG